MKKPTLTVAMPNYNHARFLHESIGAILNQSYRPMEFIIIDDGSTDNSVEIIEEFAKIEPIINFVRHERNMGIQYTSAKLLELASGDYYYGAGADDLILPGFLERSMALLEKHPEAGLCSTLTTFIDEKGNEMRLRRSAIISSKECYLSQDAARSTLLRYGNWMYGNAAIYRRKALMEVGGFMPELHSFADGVMLPLIAIKYGACFIPEPLASWRLMESGFAMSCARNPDIYRNAINKGVELMNVTHKGVLPPSYAALWERKELLRLNMIIWSAERKKASSALTNFKPPKTFSDKLFLKGLQAFIWVEGLYAKFYLSLLYRYFPMDILRRSILSFFHKMLSRIRK